MTHFQVWHAVRFHSCEYYLITKMIWAEVSLNVTQLRIPTVMMPTILLLTRGWGVEPKTTKNQSIKQLGREFYSGPPDYNSSTSTANHTGSCPKSTFSGAPHACEWSLMPKKIGNLSIQEILVIRWQLDDEQSLCFLGTSSKTCETCKWPRAWLKAQDGRGTKKQRIVFHSLVIFWLNR